jgi:2',3'-cyclic-nucleotide 2'-phosphodiesterase (5'-nucleotidase family)
VAVGNHEFDHGWEMLHELREVCDPPLLCANAKDPDGKAFGDAAWMVFDLDGVRVGVIGLVTEKVPEMTQKKAAAGCSFEDPVAVARRLVPEVRERCDVVVLLTHLGVEEDAALAGAVKGIDLIVGGHSHTELKEPLVVDGTRVVQAASYGRRVGILDLYWDTAEKRLSNVQGHLVRIDADAMPNAPSVKRLVDAWESRVAERMDVVIGKTARDLRQKDLRTLIERIYRDVLGTDFGYQNLHGVRSEIPKGDVTVRHVWTALPFDNTLVKLRLKGSQLTKYMRSKLGDRIEEDREYVIGTNSYVGDQQEKYFRVQGVPVEDTGNMMRDVVVGWVKANGGFEPRKDAPAKEAE